MIAGTIERAQSGRLIAWIATIAVGVVASWVAVGGLDRQAALAESFDPVVAEGEISGPLEVDWFVLFGLAGESYSISLERHTLAAGRISIWQPKSEDAPARVVAQSRGYPVPMIWTAPESGAWRAQVRGVNGATGSYRIRIQAHSDAVGADLSTARASSFDADGVLIERSRIDNAGDVDWFAFSVAAGNRYAIWSVLGSVDGIAAAVREPGHEQFRELHSTGSAFSEVIEPASDGIAVIAVRGLRPSMLGDYAFGVTRRGNAIEPELTLPAREMPTLQIESIEGSGSRGLAEFLFRGDWGPLSQRSGLRVWIDVDPGVDDEDEWEYLLRSLDGRTWRQWSFARRAWVDSGRVLARGFDTLVIPWSGRTAEERIRWLASVKNSDGSWTVARPALLDVPHPQPALPPLWFTRIRTGAEDPRYGEELAKAGVVEGIEEAAAVVVLDPGHGVDTGAWDNGVKEAASNLAFALRIEELLESRGVHVALTRRAAGRPYLNLDNAYWRPDYQVRAELAHVAQADLFVSIHSNANFREPFNGLEAWYFPHWRGDEVNLRLSELLMDYVQRGLSEFGYETSTLIYDATCWEITNDTCDPIYVLAPFLLLDADVARRWGHDPAVLGLSEDPFARAINYWRWRNDLTVGEPPIDLINPETQTGPGRIIRGNLMPSVLLELLYVTHPGDARILRDDEAREVIAQSIADGILDFLGIE